ncbi:hypothetical protein ACB295_10925 [Aeromonas caviae]|uniref:hypothetical protein n=1 Tax=Aeromonas caviae TaxID=648 RepID=UPI00214F5A47|nr:hypothetical protein [Aeromonas caviae]MCR3930307.1 hypothetical protein [Aeromonas caviae]
MSLAALLQSTAFATNSTYREDALGHTRYQCDDGQQGDLRKDALGNVKDSGTGITWRRDALGNVRGSNAKTGARITWREDSLGNLRASDGTVCRTNALGQLKCQGESTPPPALLQEK